LTRLLAACGLALAAACLSERPRPGPPTLSIVFDDTTVQSTTPNDTLRGTVRIQDADGLDSVWMQLVMQADTVRAGADALFETAYRNRFRFAIRAGIPAGTLPVKVEARDLVGFRSQLDTFVTVVPP